MRFNRVVAAIALALAALVSCTRDPNVAKKKYLESGNKYFEKGKYKEARIMYKDALQKDQRYGPAHYRLGLTAIKLGSGGEAVQSLRRAFELLPRDQPEAWDAAVKLCEIYLAAGRQDKSLMDDVANYTSAMLARDPNSFDGHRLSGDLNFVHAMDAAKSAQKEEAVQNLDAALAEYAKANAIKAGQEPVLVQMARCYTGKSDFPRAEQFYRQAIEVNKNTQSAYNELYKLMVLERKNNEAEGVLRLAIQNNPKQYAYLVNLALFYSLTGRRDDMMKTLGEIKSHRSDFDQAYLVVGDFYLRLGDGDSAIREYREGLANDPKKKAAYDKRIIEVLLRQGKRSEAAALNAQILKDNPNDNDAKGLAASFLLDKGDAKQAIIDLQSVVSHAPDNAVARFNLGRAHAALGEYEQARQSFQKAIEIRPDYVLARLALAELQVARGDFDGALEAAAQILKIDPNSLNARLVQSASLMGQHKLAESRSRLEAMAKSAPTSPDVFFQLGVINLTEKKYKDAEDAFRKSYQLNPANSRGLIGMADSRIAQGKGDQGLEIIRGEVEKNPARADLRLALANLEIRLGRYDDAIGEYNKVLEGLDKTSKQRGDVLFRLGEVYRRRGDFGNAVANLQKAREILPEDPMVVGTLGLALDQGGKWADAKQVYEAALKLDANNGVVLNNLAFLTAEHGGDLDDALTKGQKAKQLIPNMNEVSDTLGWIYLKKNLSDNAIDIFKDLVQKAPNQSTFRYHLAMAFAQKGDKPKAIKELQEALKLNPSKDERARIQELLAKLNGA